ncbi:MAG TPA: right-handed parallel beta-helix repeat-containing protein [Blastocatellia bacterium]|nr:right-handed parallel beta-helix repeat-containing protein [Blastocatellia bacterium]
MITRLMFKSIAAVVVLLCACALASAQATRTWVSGVGDDANPCSRTAPCKTFAGAISKTATGGEIDVLDPGGFGAVTITKSISIEACCIAGVLVSGTNGIVVSAPVGSFVVLRGLTFDGLGTGLAGIKFNSGTSLYVEDCTINDFTAMGIDFSPTNPANLFVKDTKIRNCGGVNSGGIDIRPGGGGSAIAVIDNVRAEGNQLGFRVEDNSKATFRNCIAANSAGNGFAVVSNTGAAATMDIENSMAVNNGSFGVRAVANAAGTGALARISDMRITGNLTGVSTGGVGTAAVQSFIPADNKNTDSGAPTPTINKQ